MTFVSAIPASVVLAWPEKPNAVLRTERIDYIMENALAGDDAPDLIVDAIVQQYGFNKAKVEPFREDIVAMLMELNEGYRESSKGKGASFLIADKDKNDVQWTGEHVYMEALFALGMAVGRVQLLLPRELWGVFPGEMPYYQITNDVITLEQALHPDVEKNVREAMGDGGEQLLALLSIMEEAGSHKATVASATLRQDLQGLHDVAMRTATDKPAVRSLSAIAAEIRKDWKKPYFGAVPYLDALSQLDKITDDYGADSAKSMVLYFLANAGTWRGEVAKRVKAELKKMAGIK